MKKLLTILLVAIIMQGCATTYQSNGYTGGYSETQLDENVFKVSFRGNGFTRKDRTEDFTLLRSAELAIKNGYNYLFMALEIMHMALQGQRNMEVSLITYLNLAHQTQ